MDKEKKAEIPKAEIKRLIILMAKNGTKIRIISRLWDIPERTIKYWVYGK